MWKLTHLKYGNLWCLITCESSIILKVWHGDQWIVKYVWKLTLLSIIEKEDHCTDLYIYLIQNNVMNENKSEWVSEWVSKLLIIEINIYTENNSAQHRHKYILDHYQSLA